MSIEKTYLKLLAWADIWISQKRIDNLTGVDLINEAFMRCHDEEKEFTEKNAKAYAGRVLYDEMEIFNSGNETVIDSWAVCVKCGEPKPIAAFGTYKNNKYVQAYCYECKAKVAKKNNANVNRKKCVSKTFNITVFNQCGDIVLTAKSMRDLHAKVGRYRNEIEKVLNQGWEHKYIKKYSEDVIFVKREDVDQGVLIIKKEEKKQLL